MVDPLPSIVNQSILSYENIAGIIPNNLTGGADNTGPIQNALNLANSYQVPLIIPPSLTGAAYKIGSSLLIPTGMTIIGMGGTLDFQTDHSATGVGFFIGNPATPVGVSNIQINNLKIISSNSTARNGVYGLLSIFNSTDILLQDVYIGNNNTGTGGESTAIFGMNCSNVKVIRPKCQNTYADGIQFSRGSFNIDIDHPTIIGAQDDAIGIVSVKQDGTGPIYGPCTDVHITQPIVKNSTVLGNGVALVGAQDCTVIGGSVNNVPARIFVVSQANYGGIINPSGNNIIGIRGKNAGSASQSFLVGNADRTIISGVNIAVSPGGGQILGSSRTLVSSSIIAPTTATNYAIYDDSASSRTLITGSDLSANGTSVAFLLQGTGSSQTANITA